MTEKLHQSLSSVMDGAGDDLELPRLLNAMQASDETSQQLSARWRRYHLAQGVMRGELRNLKDPSAAQVDISSAVMQALLQEDIPYTDAGAASDLGAFQSKVQPADPAPVAASVSEKRLDRGQWFRGSALAASVALLVITGVQIFNSGSDPLNAPAAAPVAAQDFQPLTLPASYSPAFSSQVAQPLSGFSLVNFSAEPSRLQPCEAEKETFLPLFGPQAVQQVTAPR